jgi:hypothetical protein
MNPRTARDSVKATTLEVELPWQQLLLLLLGKPACLECQFCPYCSQGLQIGVMPGDLHGTLALSFILWNPHDVGTNL